MVAAQRNEPDAHLGALPAGIRLTAEHMRTNAYRGYDPYDALESPLFRLPILRSSKLIRFAAQQTLKRIPLNIRPALGIPKGYNPVTLALALQGLSYLIAAQPLRHEPYREECNFLVQELKRLRSPGYSGDCWGYDFAWQTRFDLLPAYTPTIVATGFVTNALFTAYDLLGLEEALPLCTSACDFLLKDLNRNVGADGEFCWSYSPHDRQWVLNATAKGARLCAQVYSVTGNPILLDTARNALRFVVAHQSKSGAWPYAIGDARRWADNFHTAYVLDGLNEFETRTGVLEFSDAKITGWDYYRTNFFGQDARPRYFDDRLYPIDSTACGQAMMTLCGFDDFQTAARLALWSIDRLQLPSGAFAYRNYGRYTNKIAYMRWSTAWMFCGLSRVMMGASEPPAVLTDGAL